ncbi:MAG: transporter [Pseudomonadota bacterium]
MTTAAFAAALALYLPVTVSAQDGSTTADLSKKLSNPISDLNIVPIQTDFDFGFGPEDGWRMTTVGQPVIPISINEEWNVISRTIVPVIAQDDIAGSSGQQFGLGDVLQSTFLSPKDPTSAGIVWGVGPAVLIPTATDDLLGAGKLAVGPTAVALRQSGPWTVGALANHVWSVAGEDSRADVNLTYMEPFVTYDTPDGWTFGANVESTYDWELNAWSAPINALIYKLVTFGEQPVQFFAGVRYWAESPDEAAEGVGFRAGVTLLFPK